ncbi:MAG: tRNA-dihydrouridine synthase [bacterium]|nr:tRNA-dihydrouridine synthase [bacterium]
MLKTPFYDPQKTYEENFKKGPFGNFRNGKIFKDKSQPQFDFLGQKVYLPFGIPAGPILNSNFVKGAFEKGFDLVVYKTVRTNSFPCHPFPNVLSVNLKGDLTLEKTKNKLIVDNNYKEPLSITNSFGVPSKEPKEWQKDAKKAISYAKKGQVLILSFMGTVKNNQTEEEFINDFKKAAKLAYKTGAKILEVNLSCPNIGNEGLVCYNLDITEKVCKAIRSVIQNTPLMIKVGYYSNNKDLRRLTNIANSYANGISAINTIAAEIVDKNGKQALPGEKRKKSGVCGHAIKWAGIDMVKRLNKLREKFNHSYKIIGVGGVISPKDYFDYKKAGADAVMSATGAMWNPDLAKEIKKKILESKFALPRKLLILSMV